MKVLVVFTGALTNDGISNNVMNYFTYVDHDVINADFVCTNTDVPDKWKKKIESFGGKLHILPSRKKHPFKYKSELRKLIKREKYDIVHAHGNSATLYGEMRSAKKAGCPIRIAHSRNTMCTHKYMDKMLRPFFYRNYTHGFACGEAAGKWMFRNREFTVIKNGNDVKRFSFNLEDRINYRKEFNIVDDCVTLIHVGMLVEQKNHKYLLEIFDRLVKNNKRSYKLVLVGEGHLKDEIVKTVNDKGLKDKVVFLEKRDDINKLLFMSDVFVFPSLYEGVPNALIEAQISCLPCVAADTISKEAAVTSNVNFLSIKEENIDEWVNNIENINNFNERINMQDKVNEEVRGNGFDIEVNAKKLQEIYLSLVK